MTEDEINALVAENGDLKTKLKSSSEEAKAHRLSAESFRSQADDFRTKFTTTASSVEDLKKGHTTELENIKLDYGAKLTAAEQASLAAKEGATKRVVLAELRVVANSLGILDLDYLKLLDTSGVKVDENGDVLNAQEIVEVFKAAKPHMFGEGKKPGTETGTTTSTKPAPKANANDTKFDAMTATDEEWKAYQKSLKIRR